MTKDEVIALYSEASSKVSGMEFCDIHRFASLIEAKVREDEREKCAQVAYEITEDEICAAAIRARKENA